ncbi:LutC/YkgG family protein [Actinocorallia populi]|uniref:LutC/YkgG family protein n=1 Tax=Actinocorallia populi TaxID=2079200 RepID=UPI000D08E3BE|nr:lactate utilization protein C [Actinocorallia populi]
MSSRLRILDRVRAALADVPPAERPEDVPVPRDYLRAHAEDGLVVLFAERVADYRASVLRTAPSGVARTIRSALAARGLSRVVVPPGFPAAWTDLPRTEDLGTAELDAFQGVVTGAAVAIAVTGTIVLAGGPGQGRRALSLIPDHHLCVVRASQIVADLPDALARLDPARPLTFISGPSATSDIELDRVEGVHGPRTLEIIIVDDLSEEEP